MSNEQIVVERVFNAPIEKIWNAITDKNEMKQWYFNLAEFKPEVGFEFQFYGHGKEGEQYLHLCKITEIIKDKKLTHSWQYDGFEGNSFVTFELFDENGKTRLKLTHTGVETFPATVSNAFAKENFVEGWTTIIGTSLKSFLEKVHP